jgi:ornithine cyclodeaminase
MRLLTADNIRAAITMPEAIEAMRAAFVALSSGKAQSPLRTSLQTPRGVSFFMPAYISGDAYGVVKIASVYGDNPARGLPTVIASVLVFDATTGQPCAILDGTFLTTLRTGAASGLATDLLARRDAAIVGMIGAGGQAFHQIEAVCAVRPIREVRVYSRSGAGQAIRQWETQLPSVKLVAVETADEALLGADVLVAATSSSTPVILARHVRPGVHINGIGSYTPRMQEIAAEVVAQTRIVVDSRLSAQQEAGDLIIPLREGVINEAAIYAELGELASGQQPGRQRDDEITLFKSVGLAAQDAAVAARVVAVAEARQIGQVIAF